MALKEEAKEIITKLIGPVNAEKVDSFDDSNPKEFLDKCKGIISELLGDSIASANLQGLYEKYAS